MNLLGYFLLLMVVSRVCQSAPISHQGIRLFRRIPADDDDEEEETPKNTSSGASGLLIPPDDDGEDDDEEDEPTTTKRPATRAPARTTPKTASGALDFPTPPGSTGRKQGARIVFQPLGVVAFNALTKGFTSAFVPLLKNEQPTGFQYGSIPVDLPDGFPNGASDAAVKIASASSAASGTGVVASLFTSLWG